METKPRPHFTVIDRMGLGEKVAEWLFKDKLSYVKIQEKLKNEYNIEVSFQTVANFRKYIIDSVPSFLDKDEEYKNNLAKIYLDTVENLIYALQEIKTKIDEFKDPTKWRQHATYLNLLLQELHLLLKRSGEIKPNQFIKQEVEFNFIQVNQVVQTEIVRMIDEGEISLEHCSDNIKEFYRKLKGIAVANP